MSLGVLTKKRKSDSRAYRNFRGCPTQTKRESDRRKDTPQIEGTQTRTPKRGNMTVDPMK